jgi:PAS domain S-box-containing protein
MAEVDQLIAATPRVRLVERQLRRTLTVLRTVAQRMRQEPSAQERVRTLIDRLQVAVLAVDDRGRYVAASRGASALTGYSQDQLVQMSAAELGLGLHGPAISESHDAEPQPPSATRLRRRGGDMLEVQTAVADILPGLYAAALAVPEGIADRHDRRRR